MTKLVTGVLFGLIIGYAFAQLFGAIQVSQAISAVAAHYGSIALAGGSVLLTLIVLYIFRDQIAKWVFGKTTREWDTLVRDTSEALNDVAEGRYDDLRIRLTDVGQSVVATAVLWFTRAALTRVLIALVLASAGVFGTYVLVQQNGLIAIQSGLLADQLKLTRRQNEFLQQQTESAVLSAHLQHAARRSVYALEVSQIVQQIYEERSKATELDPQIDEFPDPPYYFNTDYTLRLTEELARRITNILPLLAPYALVDASTENEIDLLSIERLETRYLSPERGSILKALMNSNVNLFLLMETNNVSGDFGTLDFSYADMRNFDFNPSIDDGSFICRPSDVTQQEEHGYHYDLSLVNLNQANFSNSRLNAVNMGIIEIDGSSIVGSNVMFTNSLIKFSDTSRNISEFAASQLNVMALFSDIEFSIGVDQRALRNVAIGNPCPGSILIATESADPESRVDRNDSEILDTALDILSEVTFFEFYAVENEDMNWPNMITQSVVIADYWTSENRASLLEQQIIVFPEHYTSSFTNISHPAWRVQ